MHSPQGGSHTPAGKFPCMCPGCTHMSSSPDGSLGLAKAGKVCYYKQSETSKTR